MFVNPHSNRRQFLATITCAPAMAANDPRPLLPYGGEALQQELPLTAHLLGNRQLWIVSGVRPEKPTRLSIVVHIHRYNGCISYLDRTM